MNGNFVLDTNAVIYYLRGEKPWADFINSLPPTQVFVSVITRMELLAWKSLTLEGEKQVRSLLATLNIASLSAAIEAEAISLRRNTHIKLPDAIVAATAVVFKAVLVTGDKAVAALNWLQLEVVSPD
ncbi:MAG: type II toxin-antitoxin system VapC family toxin [Candidatus Adiutrix sp.]|jgi:predicted nucleic acid-binding protein|nr:type II toxin-antitoxin system VapC family toxin [Candidatus Adiutrix sp.]